MLDYDIEISPLDEEDKVFVGGSLGNYRLVRFCSLLLNVKLQSGWFRDGIEAPCFSLHHHLLPPVRTVRGGLLDIFPCAARCHPWTHGTPGHLVPGVGQHF